jgi:hypothetical protein
MNIPLQQQNMHQTMPLQRHMMSGLQPGAQLLQLGAQPLQLGAQPLQLGAQHLQFGAQPLQPVAGAQPLQLGVQPSQQNAPAANPENAEKDKKRFIFNENSVHYEIEQAPEDFQVECVRSLDFSNKIELSRVKDSISEKITEEHPFFMNKIQDILPDRASNPPYKQCAVKRPTYSNEELEFIVKYLFFTEKRR